MANEGLKQRIVGAVVLICGGIILWSVLFTGPVNPTVDKRTRIPPPPTMENFDVPEPQRPEGVAPLAEAAIAEQPLVIAADNGTVVAEAAAVSNPAAAAESQTIEQALDRAKKTESHLDEQGLPIAWVLQVASFGSAANAEQLKQKLQTKGYKAYTEKITTPQGESTRVMIGPKFSKERALELKKTLDSAYQVNTLIVRFAPQNPLQP